MSRSQVWATAPNPDPARAARQGAPPRHPGGGIEGGGVPPGVDPDLVRAVRERVDSRLEAEVQVRKDQGQPLGQDSERALAGSLLTEVLPRVISDWARDGRAVPDQRDDLALREAVLAEMFGLGRLEQLLGLPDVENIDITGSDPARLTLTDGSIRLGPSVASTGSPNTTPTATRPANRGKPSSPPKDRYGWPGPAIAALGVTNLTAHRATPKHLADAVRGHRGIESLHWLRDPVYREDNSTAHTGSGVRVDAAVVDPRHSDLPRRW